MKARIFIVSYVNFDGYDDNLYHSEGVFTSEHEARKAFERECATALSDAKFEDGADDREGVYTVNEERICDDEYKVSRDEGTYYTEVKIVKQEIDVPFACDRRKYGMTLSELRDTIAAFTGDKKREAMRKARIFAKHISLRYVSEITRLSYGKRQFDDLTYKENPNWLIFRWVDTDGNDDVFSIIE